MSVAAAETEARERPAGEGAGSAPGRAAGPPTAHPLSRAFLLWTRLMRRYHNHRLLHAERLEHSLAAGRRVVLIGNHALEVVDTLLLASALRERIGCPPALVVHPNVFFGLSWIRPLRRLCHVVPSGDERAAARALQELGLLMVYPGGGKEAGARSYWEEPYRLLWDGKLGFLRLALAEDAELHFVAAVGVEEMYFQTRLRAPALVRHYPLPGSAGQRSGGRLQLGLAGPHLLPAIFPLPVELSHVISPPVPLPDRTDAERSPYSLLRLQLQVRTWCQRFLDDAVAARERRAGPLDRTLRRAELTAHRLNL